MRGPIVCVSLALVACDGLIGTSRSPRSEADAGRAEADAGPTVDAGLFDGGSAEDELTVFTREVWTPLRADCVACHRTVRSFAHDDPSTAMAVALPLVRFEAPTDSPLAVRAENSHCGQQACAPGTGRRAVLAEGLRRWSLVRSSSDAGLDAGGTIDAGAPPAPDYTEFMSCVPGAPGSEDAALRLTKTQYVNTLLAAFNEPALLSFTSRSAVLHERAWSGTLVSAIAQLPEDGETGHLPREDGRLTPTHVEGLLGVAQGVVDFYLSQPARFGALGGSCVLDVSPSDACVRAFIASVLGRKLLSRPLAMAEVDAWFQTYSAGQGLPLARLLELLRAFLLHPELVLGLTWQGTLDAPEVQRLTAFEFARKLAYHFTDAPPSPQLYADAQSGALLTDPMILEGHLAGFVAGNAGTFRFPLSNHHWTVYSFLEQWLDASGFRGFPSGALAAAAFPGMNFQAGNEDWYAEARDELYSFGFRQFFVDRANYSAFFTDTVGEIGPFTSQLYGRPAGVQDLGAQRPGVLSRVGFLASGDVYPNQIIFGVRVMRNVLCQPLSPPDPGTLPANFRDLGLRDAHPAWSTREFVAQQTGSPACQGCHLRINALGATIGKYDGAGGYDRHAGVERLWSTSGALQVVGTPALDDAATVMLDGRPTPVVGLAGLSAAIAASDEGPLCLARTLFTFANRRRPTPADACTLMRLSTAAKTQSLAEAWKAVARDPSFRTRHIAPRGP